MLFPTSWGKAEETLLSVGSAKAVDIPLHADWAKVVCRRLPGPWAVIHQ